MILNAKEKHPDHLLFIMELLFLFSFVSVL